MIFWILVSLLYPDVPREFGPPMIFETSDSLGKRGGFRPFVSLDLSLLVFSLVMLRSTSLLDLLKCVGSLFLEGVLQTLLTERVCLRVSDVPEDSRENRSEKPLANDPARASLSEKGKGFFTFARLVRWVPHGFPFPRPLLPLPEIPPP
ncbi:hypothetical protein Tco_0578954 [Tanacetum coccineum]